MTTSWVVWKRTQSQRRCVTGWPWPSVDPVLPPSSSVRAGRSRSSAVSLMPSGPEYSSTGEISGFANRNMWSLNRLNNNLVNKIDDTYTSNQTCMLIIIRAFFRFFRRSFVEPLSSTFDGQWGGGGSSLGGIYLRLPVPELYVSQERTDSILEFKFLWTWPSPRGRFALVSWGFDLTVCYLYLP